MSRKNSPKVRFISRIHFSDVSILQLISSLSEINPCHKFLFAFARSCIALSSCCGMKPSPLNTPVLFSKYEIMSRISDLEFSPFSFLSEVMYL